jgi:hypothetical protein
MSIQTISSRDPHAQLRQLYVSLLESQEHFDEFKRLLALYELQTSDDELESAEARTVRLRLNTRIGEWVGGQFEGLSAAQVLLWRAIVVDQRFNVALAPWKESNAY